MKIEMYTADWCSACKTVKPIVISLENIEKEIIDVEQHTEKAISLGIRNIPVLRFLDDEDVEIGRLVGNKPKQEIEEFIVKLGGN